MLARRDVGPIARHGLYVLEMTDALDMTVDTFSAGLLHGDTDTSGYPDYNAIVGGLASHWDELSGELIVRAVVGWGGKGLRGDTERIGQKLLSSLYQQVLASGYTPRRGGVGAPALDRRPQRPGVRALRLRGRQRRRLLLPEVRHAHGARRLTSAVVLSGWPATRPSPIVLRSRERDDGAVRHRTPQHSTIRKGNGATEDPARRRTARPRATVMRSRVPGSSPSTRPRTPRRLPTSPSSTAISIPRPSSPWRAPSPAIRRRRRCSSSGSRPRSRPVSAARIDEIALKPLPADALVYRLQALLIRAGRHLPTESSGWADEDAMASAQSIGEGHVVSVFAPKGGVGKTTISVNMAVALRQQTRAEVLLFDADVGVGNVSSVLDVPVPPGPGRPRRQLPGGMDRRGVRAGRQHPCRQRRARSSPGAPTRRSPSGSRVDLLLAALRWARAHHSYVIVDNHPGYDDRTMAMLAVANEIFLVVTPEVGAVRNSSQFLELARELGLGQRRQGHREPREPRHPHWQDIATSLGLPVSATVESNGPKAVISSNEGKPIVTKFPREKISDDLHRVARLVTASRTCAGAGRRRAAAPVVDSHRHEADPGLNRPGLPAPRDAAPRRRVSVLRLANRRRRIGRRVAPTGRRLP